MIRRIHNLYRGLVCYSIVVGGLLSACGNTPALPPTRTPAMAYPTTTDTTTPTPTATWTPAPSATPTNTVTPTSTETPTAIPSPTTTPTAETQTTPLGELTPWMEGEVTVRGRVIDTASFSKGFKFLLDDGTGQVTLLMWHNVYDESPVASQLNVGTTVVVEGQVSEYRGELQIEPHFYDDVTVAIPGGLFAPERKIGTLAHHLDETATITGEIREVRDAGDAVNIWVADKTGEILVFMWDNVLERVPRANPALGTPGTRVRVTGEIQEYKGTLEIVPTLPYDVEVLP